MATGAGDAHESQYPVLTTRDGRVIRFRPMSTDDADRLEAFHEGLSERTIYQRFFGVHPHLSGADIDYFTSVDHERREALVALESERIVGVGRFDAISAEEAEVAFVVTDSHQGQSIGSLLLEYLIHRALSLGIRTLVAEILPGNGAMMRVFTRCGYQHTETHADGVVQIRIDLRLPVGDAQRLAPSDRD